MQEGTTPQPPLGLEPVNVNTAARQTKDWRDYIDEYTATMGTAPIYGFFIPIDSIQAVLQEAVKGIRVYMALNAPGDISSIHLLVVPTDGDPSSVSGNDIIYDPQTQTSTIYDTTTPCPAICGDANVLNGFQLTDLS